MCDIVQMVHGAAARAIMRDGPVYTLFIIKIKKIIKITYKQGVHK